MNNKDLRVQLPLWNIAAYTSLMIFMFSAVRFMDMAFNDFEGVFYYYWEGQTEIKWEMLPLWSFFGGLGLFVLILIAYYTKLKRYNKENPTNKLYPFNLLRPVEFLEDDEMIRHVTSNATKKVYVLYSLALLLLIFVMLIPFHRYIFIFILILFLIIKNAMYYSEIRSYISGNYRFNEEIPSHQRAKYDSSLSKKFKLALIIVTVAVLFLGALRIVQMEINHRANMVKMEECMDNGNTVVVKNEGLFSLSSVSCEEN
ncbi:hypothetical protein [Sutcliffiella deserti]|uniref:hypothetical protein n=1 Tax=Sutcliffiella deserti TaxID=2875501 RepID=UPI001CBBFDAD|nr:hypothetical protein [Sutcliffiella deserti]